MDIVQKIFSNQDNFKVLHFLDLRKETINEVRIGSNAGSPFDEGSKVLFDDYAQSLPANSKITLGFKNLLVNPISGEIFGFQWGRLTFALKCDFTKTNLQNSDDLRVGWTLDDSIDLRTLGENWVLSNVFFEDEQKYFHHSYVLSQSRII